MEQALDLLKPERLLNSNNKTPCKMTIAATTASTVPVGTIVSTGADPDAGVTTLDQADFLKLLTAQLAAQDPMEPMDNTQFISQMANFTSLQNSQSLLTSFNTFTTQQAIASAPAYIGKYVTVTDSALGAVSGIVDSVSMVDGSPSLVIGGKTYLSSGVTSISNTAPKTSATSS
jgi:flagellar basal-body rod modification protein FlgD